MKDICIICKTAEEEKEVLRELEKQECVWDSGHKPTVRSFYKYASIYEEYVLYVINNKITWTTDKLTTKYSKAITATEFLKKSQKQTIVIYRNGMETIALDKSTGKKGIARCNPVDEYDFYTGAKMAFERLADPEPEQFYNGKVVCVDLDWYNRSNYTVGKIYEFKDGQLIADNGINIPNVLSKAHSFKEWEKLSSCRWIEIVE